ncbi:MAG: hypothetical protein K8R89_09060 [Anaerolineae bacterium]|nr:hypothetical protein [Anaerolineae bacterium]
MKQRVTSIIAGLITLGLAACNLPPVTVSVLSTPVSVIPTATSQPTLTWTPTPTPSPIPTETPTATPTLTPLPTPLPDPLLKGQIGFAAYDVLEGECEGGPDGNGFYYFNLYTIVPDGSSLRHWGEFMTHMLVLSWSPDGRWALLHALAGSVPFASLHDLYLVDNVFEETVAVGLPHSETLNMYVIPYRGEVIPAIWSPGSEKAAVSLILTSADGSERDIYVLDAASRHLAPLVATPSEEAILSWSPDGEWIAYAQWEGFDPEPERLRLVVSRADGSEPREVVCCGVFPTNFHWSADGRQLVFPAFDGEALHLTTVDIEREQPFDVAQLPPSVTRADLLHGPGYSKPFDVAQLLPTTPLLYLSPDSSRYAMALNREGQTDIFVINADGSGLTNLTNHPANDDLPVWSSDGQYIAFVSNRGNVPWLRQLYVMRVDGSDVRLVSNKCVGPFFWGPLPEEEK